MFEYLAHITCRLSKHYNVVCFFYKCAVNCNLQTAMNFVNLMPFKILKCWVF